MLAGDAALNQALSSLVRDREKVNNAQSASGFTEMMEQLKQLAQKQGALNGQMQGLNLKAHAPHPAWNYTISSRRK